MVNKMAQSDYQKFDEMLIVGFGISIEKNRELRRKRRNLATVARKNHKIQVNCV